MVSLHSVTKSFGAEIGARSLWRHFFGAPRVDRHVVFQKFSVSIEAGEKVLITGSNGSGKTTLLKLMAGLIIADSGRVCLISKQDTGILFSNELLYTALTGFANLEHSFRLYGRNDAKRLHHWISYWKLDSIIDKPVETYSRGERSRLALARAMIHDPKLLFLDEPHAFLDTKGQQCFDSWLSNTEQTVVIAAPTALPLPVNRTIAL